MIAGSALFHCAQSLDSEPLPWVDVVLLTNFVPPYRLPLFQALRRKTRQFHILVSSSMEPDRPWKLDWGDLSVTLQRSTSIPYQRWHPQGFRQAGQMHIPYDTLWHVARARPDVIIAGELGARTLQAMLYKLSHRNIRVIIWATLSEVTEQGRGVWREGLRRWALPRADAVLVNGASGARYVRRFGVPEERIFLAPYTTDMRPFLRIGLERESGAERRLFFSGQLIQRKGLLPFLHVLARWGRDHGNERVQFWLLGDGPERAALERESLPTNVELRFLGSTDYDGLPGFYAQGGILAFPTLADEWGLVVNEALASGMPVLGSVYSQAVEELVWDGENGWTFRPDHPQEMYAALDRALTTPEGHLDTMRARARESIRHLTPDFVAERILEAVRFVSSGTPRHQRREGPSRS